MKINDMRVSTRLSAGFCLVLFMMLLMGISAWMFTRENVQDVDEMINLDLRKERMAEEWLTLVDRNSGASMAAMGTENRALREKILSAIANDSAKTTQVQSMLTPLIKLEEGKARLGKMVALREKYITGVLRRNRRNFRYAISARLPAHPRDCLENGNSAPPPS
ncbi:MULTISPECIES: MCP four helix bundle domain-containing protein [Enterobacteriaceae]|uniref:MCP four helix bundle domain-containing protein n=1 Tax=Enterobacteriaceae TaxID=543 RepID=UPI000E2EF49D|nr:MULTISPECIES: MCP four helix bundle domain-containing protein [Enterobacteriaceae]MBA1555214.1 hypothetical protein [Klebsiella pneumoniae]MBE9458554.1 MCP four helix bundle domain-containing protein [Enterobacter hormaechei]MBF1967684.1 MCP four helix bundle domain-containing protein [Enterobacter hormaechei]MBF9187214.1 MCP four helix bundle domain-containing protein [Enterobacter hormaechei]